MCSVNVFNLVAFLVFCFVCTTDAALGDSCLTPNNERATCVSVYDCPIILGAVRTKDATQLKFLKESQCGYSWNPLVCCGTSANYVPKVPKVSSLPDRRICGFQESDKVYGGEDADMDEFPWMALVEYQQKNGQRQFACGGALISKRYVLTAAHCLIGEILEKLGKPVMVRLGEWNTDTKEDCITVRNKRICSSPPVDVGIEIAIPHEGYNTGTSEKKRQNDIGLIKLEKDISYTNYIRAICLPLPSESSRLGEKLYIAGWGRTLNNFNSAIKQKLLIPIVDKSQCSDTFNLIAQDVSDNQICAGGEKNKDSCRGDSGGPLMRTTPSDPSQWYVEGIVSYGVACGTEGWPGIYTKVSSYLPWIYKNVN